HSQVSLVSTGTELTAFGHCFEQGTHWDAWVKYPFQPGYATVAQIAQAGKNIRGLKLGDKVVVRVPHASHHVVKETQITLVPDGISDEEAVWFALAKIAFAGVLAASLQMGARVTVVGAGPLGQMVVRWAAISPAAEIVVIDRNEKRLALARRGGATATIAKALGKDFDSLLTHLCGHRPELVFDCTGNPAVLTHALRLVADHGKIIILGDTGFPAAQSLTSDVVLRGISIIGVHDLHTWSKWRDEREIFHLFFNFLSKKRFSTARLVTHRFDPRQPQEAYLLAERSKGNTCGILFDWSRMK
ncbi:MAG TPA: zinc-binding alcohol dehydrogenase, partial [Verrucomicrobiae bacterium]|nr:zinc-binding alcohol dehydrogenase [Verrucomicrobiae bacterium]